MTNNLHNVMFFVQGANFMLILGCCIFFLTRRESMVRKVMGWVCACGAFLNLKDMFVDYHLVGRDSFADGLLMVIDMLSVPVFCMLLFELVKPGSVSARFAIANSAPFALIAVGYCFSPGRTMVIASEICSIVYGAYVAVIFIRHALNRRRSDPDAPNAETLWKWRMLVLMLSALFMAAWLGTCVSASDATDIIYYTLSIALYLSIARVIEKYLPRPERNAVRRSADSERLEAEMARLFDTERIFLEPDLNMTDVARRLGTNRTYLSNFINQRFRMTYTDYVNSRRVAYAATLLTDTDHTLDVVARMSGFSSLSNFRRLFALKYGCTPAQYRKNS